MTDNEITPVGEPEGENIPMDEEDKLKNYTLQNWLDDLIKSKEGLDTGYQVLTDDGILIPQNQITLIAGRPGHGKTTFMLNMLLNMVEKYPDRAFYYFSYEMQAKDIASCIITILYNRQQENKLETNTIEALYKNPSLKNYGINNDCEDAKNEFDKLTKNKRLWIIAEAFQVDEFRTIFNIDRELPVGAVFIDYIQKMRIAGNKSRQEQLQIISNTLLDISIKKEIPIIAGAQLGREDGKPADTEQNAKSTIVRIDNLREAGDLENDANLVLGLWNTCKWSPGGGKENKGDLRIETENRNTNTDLIVRALKNRFGISDKDFVLKWDMKYKTIEDTDQVLNNCSDEPFDNEKSDKEARERKRRIEQQRPNAENIAQINISQKKGSRADDIL